MYSGADMKKRDYFAYIIASISAIVVVLSLILLWTCYYGIIKTQTRPNNFEIPSNQRVLFISSHNYSYENVDLQIKGLGLIFNKKKINYDVEFMDAKNFPDKVHLENFYVSLKQKLFKSNSYNGVILSGDEALSFGLKYHEKLFPDIPIIYIDVTGEYAAIYRINILFRSNIHWHDWKHHRLYPRKEIGRK